ncbi:MAG: WG repeat-containing protein [Bryobacterales bacterium]|nr:WG repeat-containing protein [Bryobacterales bacterium]
MLQRAGVVAICAAAAAFGCSADGMIWMPPTDRADPLFRFVRKGKAGYIDATGKVVIEPSLNVGSNWLQAFYGGMLDLGGRSGPFLDASGLRHEYRGVEVIPYFSEGLAAAREHSGGTWGYIDRTGRFVIRPQFPGPMAIFSEGLARVEFDGKVGYINRTGRFVIPRQYAGARDFDSGLARVVVGGPCTATDYQHFDPCMRGASRDLPYTRDPSSDGYLRGPCRWRFIDKQGHQAVPGDWEAAFAFRDGLAAVKVGPRWGFIDRQGVLAIPATFDSVESFSSGLALVTQGKRKGFIDRRGAWKIELPGVKSSFSDGLVLVETKEGYTYLDPQGGFPIRETFLRASRFFHGLAHVRPWTGGYAYIDKTGRRVFTY